jgi:hypothetical protein
MKKVRNTCTTHEVISPIFFISNGNISVFILALIFFAVMCDQNKKPGKNFIADAPVC